MTVVVPYDLSWPLRYAGAAQALRKAFGACLTTIEHIGSTSVPGLPAKPIIDMLGVAISLAAVDAREAAAIALGYEALGEFGIQGRRYFRQSDPAGTRRHHFHVFVAGHPAIARHLAFRDYVRAHPPIAAEYAALKRSLADGGDYQRAKSPFVAAKTEAALAWRRTPKSS